MGPRPATATSNRGAAPGSFRGWPDAAVEFFERIEVDNTKTFWMANKPTYESAVLAPMLALLSELAAEFGEGRVFRPYRDTRFATDKRPYKTNLGAHNDAGYISFSASGLGVGTGLYMPSPSQLARYRAAVANERSGEALAAIVAELRSKDIEVSGHAVLKTAPRGFDREHPRIDLLRQKGLTAWREWPAGAWLGSAAAKKRVVNFLRDAAPLRSWLAHETGAGDDR